MDMRAEELDKFLADIYKCKTHKEVQAVEKAFGKRFNQDDVIRAAMKYGRESDLANMTAFVKDLEDKEPTTAMKRHWRNALRSNVLIR